MSLLYRLLASRRMSLVTRFDGSLSTGEPRRRIASFVIGYTHTSVFSVAGRPSRLLLDEVGDRIGPDRGFIEAFLQA